MILYPLPADDITACVGYAASITVSSVKNGYFSFSHNSTVNIQLADLSYKTFSGVKCIPYCILLLTCKTQINFTLIFKKIFFNISLSRTWEFNYYEKHYLLLGQYYKILTTKTLESGHRLTPNNCNIIINL